ncbi:sigma-54 interaction domain-containing protein [Sporomusa acidovorans]|uniref:sigma-54 interaction domain-containing protein n=1 Tax=Sporomusa acidovorans TaxID=112900 RepID=UPI000B8104BF|nr:sigma 54-interacting transcriptional regulator [Sporomusa acidovorans]
MCSGPKECSLSVERWEEIIQCRQKYLQNPAATLRNSSYIKPEVAESWIRCRNMKVNPTSATITLLKSPQELEKILTESHSLIEITKPLINTFKDIVITSGYVLQLYDKSGVTLLQEGEWSIFPSVVNPDTRKYVVWSEETIGTSAHSLSMRYKHPIQLWGPEHYHEAFQNSIASAAPILDQKGEVLASLVLIQPLMEILPKNKCDHLHNLFSHTLGLITAIAVAVETQVKLKKSYDNLEMVNKHLEVVNNQLTVANSTLEGTLASVDEGIITIDRTGKILNINNEGKRILKLRLDERKNINICNFLGNKSQLMTLVESGNNVVNIEETICTDRGEETYLVNIWPVLNQKSSTIEGAVLRLNYAEKVNALVTSRFGATASYSFKNIVGASNVIKKTIELGRRFAESPENVLIIGESGTGKELFAQSIHNARCPEGPFMAVNCAAIPRELIESELFGYERGSFTGAERGGRPGKIELANGGTLFLDEIGDMPFELQAVLLRTLEDRQVMRVGGQRYKKVNFKLIAATHKDLYKRVQENLFREDLYFRLSVLTINLPPLRERVEDIGILSQFFIERYCKKIGRRAPKISPVVQKIFTEYPWPGNIRQLQNTLIYAVSTTPGEVITIDNLPANIIQASNPLKFIQKTDAHEMEAKVMQMKDYEKSAMEYALLHANSNIAQASELLGISKSKFYKKIKEYHIKIK